jgi:hypothetical protein
MDWFEKITGSRETSYEDTRAKLLVNGGLLQSLANGKSYRIGELELLSLQALRERVKSAGVLPGRLKVGVVTGDVRQMHRSPENAGALFQVASQFNLLEMVSPTVTPEQLYPGSNPGEDRHGTAASFETARAAFEAAWREYVPKRSEADFDEWRQDAAWHAAKYARWDRKGEQRV